MAGLDDLAVSSVMAMSIDAYLLRSTCECEGLCTCKDGLEPLFEED